jgi:hypothetical protein
MAEKQKKVKAFVFLSAVYLSHAGLDDTFPMVNRASPDRIIVPVFEYNLEDSSLAELNFYPRTLQGRWMQLFVPKDAILAIVKLEDPNDKSALGFKAEETGAQEG